MQIIDLSHTFTAAMPPFPGDPASELVQTASVAKDGYTDHRLTTLMHVGTHIDAPLHMIEGGAYMDELPIAQFFGPGIVLDARGKTIIDTDVLNGKIIEPESIVLLYTGRSSLYNTPAYDAGYPAITEAFAKELVKRDVKIIGMDMLNPDLEPTFPIHKILLAHPVLIIENMTNLESLLSVPKFNVVALPMKLHTEGAPVRVVATII